MHVPAREQPSIGQGVVFDDCLAGPTTTSLGRSGRKENGSRRPTQRYERRTDIDKHFLRLTLVLVVFVIKLETSTS